MAQHEQHSEAEHTFTVQFKDLSLTREQRDAIGREIDRGVARALTDMDITPERRVDSLRDIGAELVGSEEEGPRGLLVRRT